ncbi:DUF4097 family beta strand repeat-containing protein [Nonomuraea aurantiaca]|uniref:DUF4097 family beta strand repeat-containing protein n=1 Tax=Nonomuraea aurantiaca TaxID=2878562 RepID=UPI001CD91B17|nr:DUF4097 family beta strand repeat-containing protein [Nonomuraea aurantiaca]MCA2221586.1 DUF4097 domain-containing protein [Nonomuraea aurantiaca]
MKTIVIAGGLLASALLLTGCGLKALSGPTNQDTVTYQVTDKVAKLQLKSGSGDTVLTEYDGNAVRVTETLQWRNEKPKAEHKVDGDTLSVFYSCPKGWDNCAVNYKIEVPKGLQVDADAGSGDITMRQLTGQIEASAGSGDVDASGLGTKKIFAEVGSGNLALKFAVVPDSVEMKSGSGDASLHLPAGAYDVQTKGGSGDVQVSVDKDPASPHKVSVATGSGDVSVVPG